MEKITHQISAHHPLMTHQAFQSHQNNHQTSHVPNGMPPPCKPHRQHGLLQSNEPHHQLSSTRDEPAGDQRAIREILRDRILLVGQRQAHSMISSDLYYDRFEPPGVSYKGKLIGVEMVHEPRGDLMCTEAMNKLKAMVKVSGEHKQRIIINISTVGVCILDEKSMKEEYLHEVQKVSFVSRDPTDARAFGIVAGEEGSHKFFGIKTEKAAYNVVLALKELFGTVLKSKQRQIEDYRGAKTTNDNAYSTPTPTTTAGSGTTAADGPAPTGSKQQPSTTEEEDPSALYAIPHKTRQQDIEEREASLAELARTVEVMQEGLHNMEEFSIPPPPSGTNRRPSREPMSPTPEVSMEQPIVMSGPPPTRAPPKPPTETASDPFQSQLIGASDQKPSSASEDLFKEFGDTLTNPLKVQPPPQPSANPFGPPMGAPMGVTMGAPMGVPMNYNAGFGMQQPYISQSFAPQQQAFQAPPQNQDPFSAPPVGGTDLFGSVMQPARTAPPPAPGAPKQPDPFGDLGLLGGSGTGGKDQFSGYKMAKPGEVGVPDLTPNNSTSDSDHSLSSSGQEEYASETGDSPVASGLPLRSDVELGDKPSGEGSNRHEVNGIVNGKHGSLESVESKDVECQRGDGKVEEVRLVKSESDNGAGISKATAEIAADSVNTPDGEAEMLENVDGPSSDRTEILSGNGDCPPSGRDEKSEGYVETSRIVSQNGTCHDTHEESTSGPAERTIPKQGSCVDLAHGHGKEAGLENGHMSEVRDKEADLDIRLNQLDITSSMPCSSTLLVEEESAVAGPAIATPKLVDGQQPIRDVDGEKLPIGKPEISPDTSVSGGCANVGKLSNSHLDIVEPGFPSALDTPPLKIVQEAKKLDAVVSLDSRTALDIKVESQLNSLSLAGSTEDGNSSPSPEDSWPSPKGPPPLLPDRMADIPLPDVPPPLLPLGFSQDLLTSSDDIPSPDAPPPPLPPGFSKVQSSPDEDIPSPEVPPPPLPKGYTPPLPKGFTPPTLPAQDTTTAAPPIPPRRKRPQSKGISSGPMSIPTNTQRNQGDSKESGSFRASWTNFEDDSGFGSAFNSNFTTTSMIPSSLEDAFVTVKAPPQSMKTSASSISIGSRASNNSDNSLFSRDFFEQEPFDPFGLSSSVPNSSAIHHPKSSSSSSSLHDPFSLSIGSSTTERSSDPFHVPDSDHHEQSSFQRSDSSGNAHISPMSLPIHEDPFADDPFATVSPSVKKTVVPESAEDRSSLEIIDTIGGSAGGRKQLTTSTGIPLIFDDDPFAM